MKKKILLVSGCSWTTTEYKSNFHKDKVFNFTRWPEILSDKLNMKCLNLGKSGAGNEYIFNSLIEKIEIIKPENIGLVIPAWSNAAREDWQERLRFPHLDIWKNERWSQRGDMHYFVRKSLRYFYLFQIYCEKYNIPYKQVQMIKLYQSGIYHDSILNTKLLNSKVEKDDAFKTFTNSILYKKIKSENFIGWPAWDYTNQFYMESAIDKLKLTISDIDRHPNEKGHQLIAKTIYENL